jgi:hypothetical protein
MAFTTFFAKKLTWPNLKVSVTIIALLYKYINMPSAVISPPCIVLQSNDVSEKRTASVSKLSRESQLEGMMSIASVTRSKVTEVADKWRHWYRTARQRQR